MDPYRIVGWIAGGVLIVAAVAEPAVGTLFKRPRLVPVLSSLTGSARGALVCAGLLCAIGGTWYGSWRHEHELPLTERSVVVTAAAPGESLFPIRVVVHNDFQVMTQVQLRCMVERFATDAVDFLDADVDSRVDIRRLEKGASMPFECPAPRELKPPFHSADARGGHMTIDVLFSVPDRWRRLGVRQGFDLTVGNGAPSWSREAAVLLR